MMGLVIFLWRLLFHEGDDSKLSFSTSSHMCIEIAWRVLFCPFLNTLRFSMKRKIERKEELLRLSFTSKFSLIVTNWWFKLVNTWLLVIVFSPGTTDLSFVQHSNNRDHSCDNTYRRADGKYIDLIVLWQKVLHQRIVIDTLDPKTYHLEQTSGRTKRWQRKIKSFW